MVSTNPSSVGQRPYDGSSRRGVYSRPIEMPRTRRDGLANFVQMIVNAIESGDTENAVLLAVDLHQDLTSGLYDDAMADVRAYDAMAKETEAKHQAALIKATEAARNEGVMQERRRVAELLGVAQ